MHKRFIPLGGLNYKPLLSIMKEGLNQTTWSLEHMKKGSLRHEKYLKTRQQIEKHLINQTTRNHKRRGRTISTCTTTQST
jgi:hypothetical protein